MTQSDLPETDLDAAEPIDADFEPAPTPEDDAAAAKKARHGPGWMGAGLLALLAAGTGGAIGVFADTATLGSPAAPNADIAALEAKLETLQAAQADAGVNIAKIARDSEDLEARLRTDLGALVNVDGGGETLSALVAELDTVSKRLDDTMNAGPNADALNTLTERIAALESVDTSGDASPQELSRAVAGLGERLTQLEKAIADLPTENASAAQDSLAAMDAQIAALKAELETLSSASSEDSTRVATLIDDMRAKEETALASAAEAQAVAATAIALSALETASARGDAFPDIYKDLRAAMPESAEVRALSTAAITPVPTLNTLRAAFPELRTAALKAAPTKAEPGAIGWLNRTFGDAITVKPANGEAGSAEVQLDRASAALKAADLNGAVAALKELDPAALEVFADWTESANARITLDKNIVALRRAIAEGGK